MGGLYGLLLYVGGEVLRGWGGREAGKGHVDCLGFGVWYADGYGNGLSSLFLFDRSFLAVLYVPTKWISGTLLLNMTLSSCGC